MENTTGAIKSKRGRKFVEDKTKTVYLRAGVKESVLKTLSEEKLKSAIKAAKERFFEVIAE